MDIKESKEYRLAKDWEMAVNSFSFNPERFAAAIPDMHPTLQQSLYRLIKACIKSWRTKHAVTMTGTGHRTRKRSISWNTSMNTEKCTINIKRRYENN